MATITGNSISALVVFCICDLQYQHTVLAFCSEGPEYPAHLSSFHFHDRKTSRSPFTLSTTFITFLFLLLMYLLFQFSVTNHTVCLHAQGNSDMAALEGRQEAVLEKLKLLKDQLDVILANKLISSSSIQTLTTSAMGAAAHSSPVKVQSCTLYLGYSHHFRMFVIPSYLYVLSPCTAWVVVLTTFLLFIPYVSFSFNFYLAQF